MKSTISPIEVLFPLGLGTALSLIGDATLYTVLPTHTAEAGIALSSVGIVLGANRAVRVLLNGPAGLAYDRLPRRPLFLSALFVGALSTAVYAATRGFWPLIIGRVLWGLAWSGIWVGGATLILDVTTPKNRGRWTGLYQTWFFLGAALGTLLGGILTDRLGYNTTMWIGAALTALGGLTALFLLPETRGVGRDGVQLAPQPQWRRLWANQGLWLAAVLQGVNRFVGAGVLAATLGLVVQDWLRGPDMALGVATLTGLLMAGRTLLSMLSAPLAGAASDWMGSRWGVATGAVVTGSASMVLIAGRQPAAALTGIALAAVAGGGLQALINALTGDLVSQDQRGRAIGMVHTAGDIGSASGPPVAYALMSVIGLPGVYLLCGVVFALPLIPLLWHQIKK